MIFLVFSMKRSGQHAIINWMLSQSKKSIHYNNCKIKKGFVVSKHKGKRIEDGDYLTICSIEDRPIDTSFKNVKYIVILRDPFNLVASRLRSTYPKMSSGMWTIWKQHVRTALASKDIIDINYNEWFKDINYRRLISNKLGLNFTDSGLNRVQGRAESSFDGYKYDGKAQQMDMMNRWKFYEDNDNFWGHIDEAMIKLSKQYFNFVVDRRHGK